jgi:hypothetical protein
VQVQLVGGVAGGPSRLLGQVPTGADGGYRLVRAFSTGGLLELSTPTRTDLSNVAARSRTVTVRLG